MPFICSYCKRDIPPCICREGEDERHNRDLYVQAQKSYCTPALCGHVMNFQIGDERGNFSCLVCERDQLRIALIKVSRSWNADVGGCWCDSVSPKHSDNCKAARKAMGLEK